MAGLGDDASGADTALGRKLHDKLAESMDKQRAFAHEASMGLGTQEAFRRVCDYTDQLLETGDFFINAYYRCGGMTKDVEVDGQWLKAACDSVIRTDTWVQKFSIEEEVDGHKPGQAWYCHCGKKYQPKFGVLVEMIDAQGRLGYNGGMPCALYFQAVLPNSDITDLKTLFREQKLKNDGHVNLTPQQVLARIPVVEPFALGSVLIEHKPGNAKWQGHWHLASHLNWDSLPTWYWNEFYTQFGVDPNHGKPLSKKQKKALNNRLWEEQEALLLQAQQVTTASESTTGDAPRTSLSPATQKPWRAGPQIAGVQIVDLEADSE